VVSAVRSSRVEPDATEGPGPALRFLLADMGLLGLLISPAIDGGGHGARTRRGVSIMVMALSWFEPFEQSVEIHARLGVGIDCDAG